MSVTKIFLVRHGETEWNLAGKMQGHLDSPLTATGQAQAQALAKRLQHYAFAAIYSSDLTRAYQTALYIAEKKSGQSVLTDSRLRERCLGIFQGVAKDELPLKFPQEFALYQTQEIDYVVPKGESVRQFRQRCLTGLTEIAQQYSEKSILVVAHGGVLVSLFKHTLGLPPEAPRRFEILNTSLNVFSYHDNHWRLETWGDLSHLEQLQALDDF